MELTDEEREKRRQRALALHEQGKFGGAQPGSGRPRKKRVAEVIAEKVADEAQTIYDRLMQVVREGTDSNAISASRQLIEIEEKEAIRLDREDDKIDSLHRDQLLLLVATQMKELYDRGLIPDLPGVVDAEFEEVANEGTRQLGEVSGSAATE
jgi:hypothetical protein